MTTGGGVMIGGLLYIVELVDGRMFLTSPAGDQYEARPTGRPFEYLAVGTAAGWSETLRFTWGAQ